MIIFLKIFKIIYQVPGYSSGTFEKSSKWKRTRVEESESFNRVMSRPTLSETEVFADLDVAQDLSKRVPENDNQDDTVNLATTVDHKPSTSEINVSYGEEAPTPTDLVQGMYLCNLIQVYYCLNS